MHRTKALSILLLIAALTNSLAAQQSQTPAAPPQQVQPTALPQANLADVASPDAIIAALYDVISGAAGKKRDWNRMRSLFRPEGRLIPVVPRCEGGFTTRYLSVEDYIKGSGAYLETNGFFERETNRKQERYGNLVHAFSAYESRHKADDAQPFARGTNSIQLMFDGTRWWVVNVAWDSERPAGRK